MRKEFEPYINMVEFLGKIVGSNTEVVLHDLTDLNNSIIAISNGQISGRSLGGPASSLIIKVMEDAEYKKRDYLCNYRGLTSKGKQLSSSTFFIKDDQGVLIGMLCINSDNEELIKARNVLNSLLKDNDPVESDKEDISELFSLNVDELTLDSIRKVVESVGVSPDRMSPQEKTDVVRRLYEMGIYNLKGSVAQTSSYLKISEPSVYRYLNQVKNNTAD